MITINRIKYMFGTEIDTIDFSNLLFYLFDTKGYRNFVKAIDNIKDEFCRKLTNIEEDCYNGSFVNLKDVEKLKELAIKLDEEKQKLIDKLKKDGICLV